MLENTDVRLMYALSQNDNRTAYRKALEVHHLVDMVLQWFKMPSKYLPVEVKYERAKIH